MYKKNVKYLMPTVAAGVVAIIIISAFGILLMSKPCVEEGGSIGYGIEMKPSGQCCEGLVEKAPEGYVGGAFCVRPECDVECLACGSESEGLYIVCPNEQSMLIGYYSCCY